MILRPLRDSNGYACPPGRHDIDVGVTRQQQLRNRCVDGVGHQHPLAEYGSAASRHNRQSQAPWRAHHLRGRPPSPSQLGSARAPTSMRAQRAAGSAQTSRWGRGVRRTVVPDGERSAFMVMA